jgi:thymidylate kinase
MIHTSQNIRLPRFVVFEGVDGSGKTTLARALTQYYTLVAPDQRLYANSFPGSTPGTLGEWVYRLHHNQAVNAPSPDMIAPPALQLLHIAAHVDTILTHITPTLAEGGCVILDRYWWSTYSYSRMFLSAQQVWPLVNAERNFLEQVPQPIVIYLTRSTSLKANELSPTTHRKLDTYYHELLEHEKHLNQTIYEINNDSHIEKTWIALLARLGLPYLPQSS